MLALCAAPAQAICYADPVRLKAAVGIEVASYKCSGFKAALTGKAKTIFMSRGGVIDQMTGSCLHEIALLVDQWSFEAVKDRDRVCREAEAALAGDEILRKAAADAGVR